MSHLKAILECNRKQQLLCQQSTKILNHFKEINIMDIENAKMGLQNATK